MSAGASLACAALLAAAVAAAATPSHGLDSAGFDAKLEAIEAGINAKRGFVVTPETDFESWLATQLIFEIVEVPQAFLGSRDIVQKVLSEALAETGLVPAGEAPQVVIGGNSIVVPLTAGHVAATVDPANGYVGLDVFVDPHLEEAAVLAVSKFAGHIKGVVEQSSRIPRGIPSDISRVENILSPAAIVEAAEEALNTGEAEAAINLPLARRWSQRLSDHDLGVLMPSLESEYKLIYSEKSKWQLIEFLENPTTGDVCLFLDLLIQICKSFDAAYSEVYVHLPAAYLPRMKKVLIVGGGDALALREVLEYDSVERVVQLELDERIPALCEKYFDVNAHLPGNPDTDPRVEWIFGDAAKTVQELIDNGELFDVILMDISETDPSGSVSTLDFFTAVSAALHPRGVFIKNDQNYQLPVSTLFNEFVEVAYPVAVITEQTFVLGSNGTSLLPPPSFKVFDENYINTTFLAHGPSTGFRQLQGMVRRYESRRPGLDVAIDSASSVAPGVGSGDKPEEYSEEDGHQERIQVQLSNMDALKIGLLWLDSDDSPTLIAETIESGSTFKFDTYLGHLFEIVDAEKPGITLAKFFISPQHKETPHIVFASVQAGLKAYASVSDITATKPARDDLSAGEGSCPGDGSSKSCAATP
mmetsp:Transcript_7168/g.20191  ORF Transcript_7168/g.20191 Transcript_7168/m.20191 type:complete len:645 (+) Transcript_7168:195-2129(+)